MQFSDSLSAIKGLSEQFVCKRIGAELLLVPLRDNVADFNQYFSFNELGSFIYDRIVMGQNFSEILSAILAQYEVTEAQAQSDLQDFIKNLHHYITNA
ncbi:MAG: hypothetical protein RLZZ65_274 [Bacteroidota bacterium]|jgi:hypothetical protein